MLVLMVRGIFFKLKFPYAHFRTENVTGDLLFPIFWEDIRQVEGISLKVIFVTAAQTGNFFKCMLFKTRNIYGKRERWLYVIHHT